MGLGKWIGLAIFLLSLYILWQIRQLLLIIFLAVVLANALNILVGRFQHSGIKRGYAVLLSVVVVVAVLAGFFWLIVPPFTAQLEELIKLVPKGIQRLSEWLEVLQDRLDPQFLELLPDVEELTEQLQPLLERLLGGGLTFFSSSLGILLNFLLVIVLTLMILADPTPYRRGFIRLFPSFYRRRVDEILFECEAALQAWLLAMFVNMGVITVLSFVGLLVLRVPLALSQALLAGLLNFLPNIGPTLSVIPPIAIALLEEPWKAPAVLVLYLIIQQVESSFLTPVVMAQKLSLLPAVTLLAQVFFATFFGFLGLFLALPLTVVAQVWVKEVLIGDILDDWDSQFGRSNKTRHAEAKGLLAVSSSESDVDIPVEDEVRIAEDMQQVQNDEQ